MKNVNWTHVAIAAGIGIAAGVVITNMGYALKVPTIGTIGMPDNIKAALKAIGALK